MNGLICFLGNTFENNVVQRFIFHLRSKYSVFGFFLARGFKILKSKHSFPQSFMTVDFSIL